MPDHSDPLPPCPKCDSRVYDHIFDNRSRKRVICESCGFQGPAGASDELADREFTAFVTLLKGAPLCR